MIEEKKMNTIVTNMRNSTKPKPLPVKANKQTWYFDTPQGVDHVTKVLHDNTDMKPEDVIKLNRESKEQLIKQEEKGLLKYDANNIKSYPSDPEQRRRLVNIENLEKSMGVRTDTWKRFVKTGAMPLVPKNFVSNTKMYEAMLESMEPNERRNYLNEQKRMESKRRLELRQDKIKDFKEKAALKEKKSAPAKAMAAEIVKSIVHNPIIEEVLNRSKERLENNEPKYTLPPVKKEMGLNRVFTQSKLDEAATIRKVLDE
tara:strand:+ start:205 stop:978 length:774 start_codon:yes stop_codon:yes gene_type:complete